MKVLIGSVSFKITRKPHKRFMRIEGSSGRKCVSGFEVFFPVEGGSLYICHTSLIRAGKQDEICWEHFFGFYVANVSDENLAPFYYFIFALPNDSGFLLVVQFLIGGVSLVVLVAYVSPVLPYRIMEMPMTTMSGAQAESGLMGEMMDIDIRMAMTRK